MAPKECDVDDPDVEDGGETERASNGGKCMRCFKMARKGCTQSLCIKCCDDDNCVVHREQRERTAWRELVMMGNTDVQQAARERRGRLIPKGRFRESNFVYLGDTVVIWDLQQCMTTPRLKDEILRKCQKRKAREIVPTKVLRNSRKRFHRVMEQLYEESLKKL